MCSPVVVTARRTRGGDAEGVHGLADHVFTQHGAEGRLAVTPARERRAAGALEMEIPAPPVPVDHLTDKQGPPVAESRRVPAELVTGVRLGDGRCPVRRGVAHQQGHARRGPQITGVESEL